MTGNDLHVIILFYLNRMFETFHIYTYKKQITQDILMSKIHFYGTCQQHYCETRSSIFIIKKKDNCNNKSKYGLTNMPH